MIYKEKIKEEFNNCKNKLELVEYVADKFQMNPVSIRSNWFSNHWSVPVYKQEKLVDLMQKYNKQKYKNQ
tara:strand:- start:243 stop:452 length:210 start_codon:yes stop_codon:yes gene_type:complete